MELIQAYLKKSKTAKDKRLISKLKNSTNFRDYGQHMKKLYDLQKMTQALTVNQRFMHELQNNPVLDFLAALGETND
jgi:hypothetical protein